MLFLGQIIGAAINLGTSIFGSVQANKARKEQIKLAESQMEKSNKLRETAEANRVDYKTPQELEDNIANAKASLNAGDNLVQSAAETAGATTANVGRAAERTATSGSQALAAVQAASVESGKEVGKAAETAEERKARKRAELAAANRGIASSRDREFDVNVAQPYFQAISDARQLESASLENRQGAIDTQAQNAANLSKAAGKAGNLISQVDFGAFGRRNKNPATEESGAAFNRSIMGNQ